jgi:pimeloyl-ACP methyl ester carboxylesterase
MTIGRAQNSAMRPQTRYAKSGEVHIAYQTMGNGPIDIIFVPGWISHVDLQWEQPAVASFLERLASFSRLIVFDKRGTGLSDRIPDKDLPALEQRMDDVRAVMDAVASERAVVVGYSEGGPMAALFAATYPDRTTALILYGSYARWSRDADYPWALSVEEHESAMRMLEQHWGTAVGLKTFAPSVANDETAMAAWAKYLRAAASPSAAMSLYRMNIQIDIRSVLPAIRVPTLVLHRSGDRLVDVGNGRYLAKHIPGARYVELPGVDHLFFIGDVKRLEAEIEEFLTGARAPVEEDTVLATVLFVDIVESTQKASTLGDLEWRRLLDRFMQRVEMQVKHFRGRVIDTAGDGVFASFDGPARAIRCARDIRAEASALGLRVRAGLHTGECQIMGDKMAGIAIHVGARVAGHALPDEILVSETVKSLTAGSGLRFDDRGQHALKGIEGDVRLYGVT